METSFFAATKHFFSNFVHLGFVYLLCLSGSASARAITQEDQPIHVEQCQYDNSTDTYSCKSGHCCEGNICCSRYFEHWWFWCIWIVIILLSCCCFYHHQKRKRTSNTTSPENNRSEGIYSGACNYPGPPIDKEFLGYCKLPKYAEVIRIPPSGSPPPPYSERRIPRAIARISSTADNGLEFMQQNDLTSSVMSLVANTFNFNFRGSTQFLSPTDSNQNVMESISELTNGNSVENAGALLDSVPAVTHNESELSKEVEALMTNLTPAEDLDDETDVKII